MQMQTTLTCPNKMHIILYSCWGKGKDMDDWVPVQMRGQPFSVRDEPVLFAWVEALRAKFPENEYEIRKI